MGALIIKYHADKVNVMDKLDKLFENTSNKIKMMSGIIDTINQKKGQEGAINDPAVKKQFQDMINKVAPGDDELTDRLEDFLSKAQRGGRPIRDKTNKAFQNFKNKLNSLFSFYKFETIVKIMFLIAYPESTENFDPSLKEDIKDTVESFFIDVDVDGIKLLDKIKNDKGVELPDPLYNLLNKQFDGDLTAEIERFTAVYKNVNKTATGKYIFIP